MTQDLSGLPAPRPEGKVRVVEAVDGALAAFFDADSLGSALAAQNWSVHEEVSLVTAGARRNLQDGSTVNEQQLGLRFLGHLAAMRRDAVRTARVTKQRTYIDQDGATVVERAEAQLHWKGKVNPRGVLESGSEAFDYGVHSKPIVQGSVENAGRDSDGPSTGFEEGGEPGGEAGTGEG